MKKTIISSLLLLLNLVLYAQEEDRIVVKRGTSLLDYFSLEERYLYPEFTQGIVLFKTGVFTERKFNYNYLNGEIEFLQNLDTLIIANKNDIEIVIIAEDTLYYDNGYILQLKSGYPKIGLKEEIEFSEFLKDDGYGPSGSTSSRVSFNTMASDGQAYKLKVNDDMVYKRTKIFYMSSEQNNFILLNKKNVYKLFPDDKNAIKSYLKANKTKFDSEEDLIKLWEYLQKL